MIILSENQIKEIYSMKDAIEDLEKALVWNTEGEIANPHRTVFDYPAKKASALYMPSSIGPIRKSAVKVVTIFPENPSYGKKTTQGVILLTDTENGDHLACINASYLTRLRTGAASAIAADYLARKAASSVAVIGCGAMAEEQLKGVMEVRKIDSILLYNRTEAKARNFAGKIGQWHPEFSGEITIEKDANDAVSKADMVICSTRSETPVFSGEALKQGAHINGVGSYLPHMQEVDETTVLKAGKIVVDTVQGAKEEAGDLLVPANAGRWDFSSLHGELGEMVSRQIPGREDETEITFFKSVGTAYFDLAVAASVYEKAVKAGAGTQVEM
ncbi:NAD(P)-binding domain-containing protein [Bacillus sp. REN3]|uniref:ornithine cyclodeaminase family protein n=1 Tax=Bacillus sp. REN3 TaxID=2802440 RepID=UPI001AEDA7B2|nr:NAD(P)-binding domain-containing protein [Bacillus sp. REN3]